MIQRRYADVESTAMNPSTSVVPLLDPVAAARERQLFEREQPWFHDSVAETTAERLRWMRDAPKVWLDWQPSWGGARSAQLVAAACPHATRLVFEPSEVPQQSPAPSRWRWLPGKRSAAPDMWDGQTGVDMVWANMALRSERSPEALMQAWRLALRPQGFVMFTGLGPHTLESLRAIYERHGWASPCAPFTDMHDWGDMLIAQGFDNPVMDASFLELTYTTAQAALQDLRLMGRNIHEERHAALRSRQWHQALLRAMESELDRDARGRLILTLEVIQGHAVNPASVRSQGATTTISEGQMRGLLSRR